MEKNRSRLGFFHFDLPLTCSRCWFVFGTARSSATAAAFVVIIAMKSCKYDRLVERRTKGKSQITTSIRIRWENMFLRFRVSMSEFCDDLNADLLKNFWSRTEIILSSHGQLSICMSRRVTAQSIRTVIDNCSTFVTDQWASEIFKRMRAWVLS